MDYTDIRSRTEAQEAATLSPYATLSAKTKGRAVPIKPCSLRTDFQRDRDRIIHCKSFRRLKHKTQVFLAPQGDHYRTRLTHTLEVSQIARTIARALQLNEDLTEAIALGHDLGHTPFGHTGEDVLNHLVPGGFEHNRQSLRMVETLENNGKGLNLTFEVKDGILHHKKSGTPATLEGAVVNLSDRIAYINHDIDDALRAGVLLSSDIPIACSRVLGETHGERINNMIVDVVQASMGQPAVRMSEQVGAAFNDLRNFMFERVYLNPAAKKEEEKARHVVEALFFHCIKHIDDLPPEFLLHLEKDGVQRVAGDWIACMTDHYAINAYKQLFVPTAWM
ncbi:deoxyguanosinetriphosphate triphosphohydrolase [Christensenellaceae bacterium OttesenSCG-928-L17]|nr:deoxyguanosinetriphosphate triphosphohydrolase [Christensenellaceae bacterium OttesenSCG-928-L17]